MFRLITDYSDGLNEVIKCVYILYVWIYKLEKFLV